MKPDTQAPGFYWCTIQACAGIISACLPTLRPLIRGRSMESLIASMRRKCFSSWPASKLSDGSSSSRQHMKQENPASDASSDGVRGGGGAEASIQVGKPMGVSRQYDTSVEAMQMSALDIEPGMEGIHVNSSIEHDLSFVYDELLLGMAVCLGLEEGGEEYCG